MLRSNHLVQTVRTTFPVVQTVPFTFPLGISHLHLWRSGDGFSDSVCTAGKKMASLQNLILSLSNFNFAQGAIPRRPYSRAGGGLLGKRAQEVWEKKRRRGK